MNQGFLFCGDDNDSVATAECTYDVGVAQDEQVYVHRCPICKQIQNKWTLPFASVALSKSVFDVSVTRDGITVVSDKFRDTYHKSGLSGLALTPIDIAPGFYTASATAVVPFDFQRRRTRFIDKCHECGTYRAVAGATPVYLTPGTHIADNSFVRTDVEFGTDDEKHALILCGLGAGAALRKAKLKGLHLLPF
jgi:hypothetical protein